MLTDFREDQASWPHADPLAPDGGTVDFSWDDVARSLGEIEEATQGSPAARELAGVAIRRLLEFLVRSANTPEMDRVIGRRALALAWCINPEIVGGKSLQTLATGLGLTRAALSAHASAAAHSFGNYNRTQLPLHRAFAGRRGQALF